MFKIIHKSLRIEAYQHVNVRCTDVNRVFVEMQNAKDGQVCDGNFIHIHDHPANLDPRSAALDNKCTLNITTRATKN